MPKKTKLYVKVDRTLVKLDKFPSILSSMPNGKDIGEHFEACRTIGKYQPIEIEVSDDDFGLMVKEIRKCLGINIGGSSIPVVLGSNYHPIVRFNKKQKTND